MADRNNNDDEDSEKGELNQAFIKQDVSLYDCFEFFAYITLVVSISFVCYFTYYYGRYYEFKVPFSVMDFSSSNIMALISSFVLIVFGSLLFKTYTKISETEDAIESVKNMENFMAILVNIVAGVAIVFGIIDLMKNASLEIGLIIVIVSYVVSLFFYFKGDKSVSERNYLCGAFIFIMVLSFYVMGILSTKIEMINIVRIDGDAYRVVQTGSKKTILSGYESYAKRINGKIVVYYNDTGKYLQINSVR